jgi:hypothetical protein
VSFADTAALGADPDYQARLSACVFTEALGKADDSFADTVIKGGPPWAVSVFGPTVASAPGLGEKYATGGQEAVTDGDLLSAVQGSWDRLAGLYSPSPFGL